MNNQQRITNHFEAEAKEYDQLILNLIPNYAQMIEALVAALPKDKNAIIEVIDLGCGTGTIAAAIKQANPKARLTCVDVSQNMLDMARAKLADASDTRYILSDFYDFSFDQKYDAVVSSLALHHLQTNADKLGFYQKIHDGLKDPGRLINADIITAPTEQLQAAYMQAWRSFMIANTSLAETDNKWIPTYYAEDRPISLDEHFAMLDKAGFTQIKTLWQYNNFTVYQGEKSYSKITRGHYDESSSCI